MTASLQDRKLIEANHLLAALNAELGRWAGWPTGPVLSTLADRVEATRAIVLSFLEEIGAAPADLSAACHAEFQVVGAHKIWQYFAEKFQQRETAANQLALQFADELAWSCYGPFLRQAALKGREPPKIQPLVYFSLDDSPFAIPRGGTFVPASLGARELDNAKLQEITSELPVSIIGLPWFHVHHAPHAPVIAHEVGHLIEEDFGLRAELEAALLAAVGAPRRDHWRSWRRECFADFIGALTMGPSYALALMGYLADDPARIAADPADVKASYPPRDVRVAFVAEILRLLHLDRATPVLQDWRAVYGAPAGLDDLATDARALAAVWLDVKPAIFGVSLKDVPGAALPQPEVAEARAQDYLKGLNPQPVDDIRHLVAAAALAYADAPDTWLFQQGTRGVPYLQTMAPARPPFKLGPISSAPMVRGAGGGPDWKSRGRALFHRHLELLKN